MLVFKKVKFLSLFFVLIGVAQWTWAAIHVQATRVVYEESLSAGVLPISNKSDASYMVQSWINSDDSYENSENVPFIIVPPLVRLNPGEEAVLRVIYSGETLPEDKESLFWINVQEIPPSAAEDTSLQIAIRTRIKLFYRPEGLNTNLEKAVRQLTWEVADGFLKVKNSSKLHITFSKVFGRDVSGSEDGMELDMLAPGEEIKVNIDKFGIAKGVKEISFSYINEYGGVTDVMDAKVSGTVK